MLTDEEYECFLKVLGTRIKQLRKHKNVNMRDIMISTGYYDSQWRKYESGGSMNFQSLMKIALALDVSLGELLDGLGQWPKLSVAEIQEQRDGKATCGKDVDRETDPPESGSGVLVQAGGETETSVRINQKKSPLAPTAGPGRSRRTSSVAAQHKRKSEK